ncbi:MAG: METTL5 family protein [Thermoplasmata archaeon]|nr:METTL5 family protein [Thermoplasmata archaeon]
MKQRELEITLQSLKGFTNARPDLEQYPTPARIAADVLYTAHSFGDVAGKRVIDLGCGPGIFSIGACLLGAGSVTGLDTDAEALKTASENARLAGCEVTYVCSPVEKAEGKFDTCIMNPPFGSQNRHADLPFLEKAMDIASVVYSIHNSGTIGHLSRKIVNNGWIIDAEKNYSFEIRHTFSFHTKEKAMFDVTLIRIVRP